MESIKRNSQGKENQRGRNLDTTSAETRSSWFIVIFFFSFIRFGHTVYCMNDYAFPAHCNNDDTRRLYYRLTQIDLYTFFFLFLCYTQLAVSLTFMKSKADTFLNMYILSFIFLFFLSLFFSSRFYPRLKSRHGRLMDVYSIGGKKEGILYVHLYKNHHGDIVLYAYRCPGTTLTGLANEN